MEALQETVNEVGVTAEAARPLGVEGTVVSAGAGTGAAVWWCRHHQCCAWLTLARVRPELIAIPRRICRRFTMPPFAPSGLLQRPAYAHRAHGAYGMRPRETVTPST